MLYLDTSVVVAALTHEVRSHDIQSWLAGQALEDLAISDWTMVEFSSALSIKLRTGQIDLGQRAQALAMFHRLAAESLTILPMAPSHFRTAATFADQYALGLRAADALHVAICLDRGAALCTLDRRLADAGPALGVATVTP